MAMMVSDIMTSPVISVLPETPIVEAARLLLKHRISGLPVADAGGNLVGIVTEGDLLRRAEIGTERRRARWLEFFISPGRLARDYADAHARTVGEVMSTDIVSVGPDDALTDVVQLMERHHIKRVPVVSAGAVVGIVSRANLVRALLHSLRRPKAGKAAPSDEKIRQRILAEISRQPWGPRASVDVRVAAGTVELYGSITDDRERVALKVLAENVPGVKAVRDKLVWVDPVSGYVIPTRGTEPPAED